MGWGCDHEDSDGRARARDPGESALATRPPDHAGVRRARAGRLFRPTGSSLEAGVPVTIGAGQSSGDLRGVPGRSLCGPSLRICLAVSQFRPIAGGEERHAEILGTGLAARGHRVTVLTQHLPELPPSECVGGVRVERRIRSLQHTPLFAYTYVASVARFLLRHRHHFDILQATFLYWDAVAAALLKPLLGCRLVVRFVIPGPGGDLERFRSLCLFPGIHRQGTAVHERLLTLIARRADAFIVLTTAGQRELVLAGMRPERCYVVPNGIEVERFRTVTRRPPTTGAQRLISVARLVHQKGLDVLIQALPRIRAAIGNVTLAVLGDGPERDRLTTLATHLGIGESVRFEGVVPDVAPHLAAADAFVLPSRFEGLPLALLEAMAAGVPVIATAVDGNTDVVSHGINGLLVPPDDPTRLADAVTRVLADPDEAERIGAHARQTVQKRYSAETMIEATLSAYRAVLQTGA